MNFISTLKLIFSVLPAIIDAVKTIEKAIPEPGKGAEKLNLIYNILTTTYEQSNKAFGTFDQVWPIISSTVQATVNAFNSTGIFKK
jgi:hypothetical protein